MTKWTIFQLGRVGWYLNWATAQCARFCSSLCLVRLASIMRGSSQANRQCGFLFTTRLFLSISDCKMKESDWRTLLNYKSILLFVSSPLVTCCEISFVFAISNNHDEISDRQSKETGKLGSRARFVKCLNAEISENVLALRSCMILLSTLSFLETYQFAGSSGNTPYWDQTIFSFALKKS